MPEIAKIGPTEVRAIKSDIESALIGVAAKYGLSVNVSGAVFDDKSAEFKVAFEKKEGAKR